MLRAHNLVMVFLLFFGIGIGASYATVVTDSSGDVIRDSSNNILSDTNGPVITVPVITTQPVGVTVKAPSVATFTVVATGYPALSYQWQQALSGSTSFTNIVGATASTYTTSTTDASFNGRQYQCVVSNATGSLTSNAVALLVNLTANEPPPVVSLTTDNTKYGSPATVTLTATASQSAGGSIAKVEFYNGATLIGTAKTAPYTFAWSNAVTGNYSLTARAYNDTGLTTNSSSVGIAVMNLNVYVKNITYNVNGQVTQIQYGNGTVTTNTYNPANFRLTRIYTVNASNQIVQDLNYTYDSIGQVLSIKDNVNIANASMTQSFAYDALNRLTQATGAYGKKSYSYDPIGNISTKDGLTYNYGESNTRLNASGTSIGAAGPHAVTSLSDGTVFKYDANGNMLTLQKASNTTQYMYDSQNRLCKVAVGGLTAASYVYDGDGGRTEKTVIRRDLALYNENINATLFGNLNNKPPLSATAVNPTVNTTIDVGNLYETESTATNGSLRSTKFIYLGSTRVAAVNADGTIFYYHGDHLGGTNVVTDQSGSVRELTTYDPFGQVVDHEKYGNTSATAWYYFAGRPLDDETGLIFLGARYYNPTLGRFITPDTVVQSPNNPQTLNRYTYCNNNPVNLIDPSGHSWWSNFWKGFAKVFEDIGLAIVAIAAVVFQPELVPVIGSLMAGIVTGAAVGAAIGGISSSILGGDMGQGILTGAIGGAIFGGIGSFGLSGPAQVGAHFAGGAASGAIDATITGGNAGISAMINGLSAGATEWAGESTQLFKFTGSYMTDVVKQAALGGIVGGAASSAMGGSFARGFESGAENSAIAYTANDWVHDFANHLSLSGTVFNETYSTDRTETSDLGQFLATAVTYQTNQTENNTFYHISYGDIFSVGFGINSDGVQQYSLSLGVGLPIGISKPSTQEYYSGGMILAGEYNSGDYFPS